MKSENGNLASGSNSASQNLDAPVAPMHTPGPWEVAGVRRDSYPIRGPESERLPWIADVCAWATDAPDEAQANAHLIAAAPDLLRALEDITQALADRPDLQWPRLEQPLSDAKTAIAKAKA